MGRRKSIAESTSTEHETDEPKGWQPEPAPEYVSGADDELDQVFSDFPQNEACIELFRINAQGGRPMFLEEITPATFSFAYVTNTYGGGRYMAKGKYKDGSKRRMPFEIEGEPIIAKRKAPQQNTQPMALPAVNQTIERVIETGQPGGDFQAALLTMMRQMIQEARTSETQMLEKMRLYKELFGVPTKQEAPLDVALNMFQKGVELAGMNGGGGEGANFWMLALKELKDPLTKIVDTINHAVVRGGPTRAIAGAPPAAQPVAVAPAAPEGDAMLGMVRAILPALINGAAKNADPGVYVDFVLDQVPGTGYTGLCEWLRTPDCLDKLAFIEPGIRFQQEWWAQFRGELLHALEEELGNAGTVQPQQVANPTTGSPTDNQSLS